jgi:hypothetical protein
MGYDEKRGVVLLYGGLTDSLDPLHETWAWDGVNWQRLSDTGPLVDLPGRVLTSMGPNGDVILFGGKRGNKFLRDTWVWDGAQWTRLEVTGPASRFFHGIAFDPARGAVLLFGGSKKSGKALRDAWEFRGGAWAKLAKCP